MIEWTPENIAQYRLKGEPEIYSTGAGLLIQNIRESLIAASSEDRRGMKLRESSHDAMPADVTAKAIHEALRHACPYHGHDPDIETFLREQEFDSRNGQKQYHVSWEAGPYDWAIPASFAIMDISGRLCEPYYGFDLQLYDWE